MLLWHYKMSLQDKIEDIEEGGMDRKEADDVNQVFYFRVTLNPIFYFFLIQGFFVRLSQPQHQRVLWKQA